MSISSRDALRNQLIAAQYDKLSDEVVEYEKIQSQEVALAIIALGTVIVISAQSSHAAFTLAYPILVLFLALAWAADERGIRLRAAYIADRIENPLKAQSDEPHTGIPEFGWDTYIRAHRSKRRSFYFAAGGIFVAVDLAAILVGAFLLAQETRTNLADFVHALLTGTHITNDTLLTVVLFATALISTAITIVVVVLASSREYHLSSADEGNPKGQHAIQTNQNPLSESTTSPIGSA